MEKIRHTYDLHQLLQQDEFLKFFQSAAFEEMLLKVASDDVLSFRNNNKWLENHPSKALLFRELDTVWKELTIVYKGDFSSLVYGSLPSPDAVFETLTKIKKRLEHIPWTIVNLK